MGNIKELPIVYQDSNLTIYKEEEFKIYYIQCAEVEAMRLNEEVWENDEKPNYIGMILR